MSVKQSSFMKKASAVVAVLALTITTLGGTFAWKDYTQHKSNELSGTSNLKYEARLVEDFQQNPDWNITHPDWDKKISINNPGDPNEGYGNVYVRMQLKEYMEISKTVAEYTSVRYMLDSKGAFIRFSTEAAAKAEYPNNNVAYLTDAATGLTGWFVETLPGDQNGQMGKFVVTGFTTSTTPVPVIPGTVRATDADISNNFNQTVDLYDANGNLYQGVHTMECDYPVHTWTTYTGSPEPAQQQIAQYVNWTLNDADIITYDQWIDPATYNSKPVAKWIVCPDGWVYWGMPLAPGQSTPLFLESVHLISQPDGSFYYVIHTDMEAVSLDELTSGNVDWDGIGDSFVQNAHALSLSMASATVEVGKTLPSPTVSSSPAGWDPGALTWRSSNPAIASVDPKTGVVTGVAPGTTTVTVTAADGTSAFYLVTVTGPSNVPATSVKINGGDKSMVAGDKSTPGAVVLPANSTEKPVWSSSNPSVASVDPNTGEITANAPGTAVITAKVGDGSGPKTDSITVTVTAKQVPATDITFDTSVVNANNMTVKVDQTKNVGATIVPSNSTDTLTYSSSNPAIFTVDAAGNVKGVTAGTGTLTVKAGSVTKTVTVTVNPADATGVSINNLSNMVVGDPNQQATYTLVPPASAGTVTWTSSNPAAATIDPNTGMIHAVAAGDTIITATLKVNGVTVGTDTAPLTVTNAVVPATGVTINSPDQNMNVGDTFTPSITITPPNSTDKPVWSSSDPSVASVDPNTGKITANKPGDAVITVTVGGKSDTMNVHVTQPAEGLSITGGNTVNVNADLQLTAVVTPSNTSNPAVTWKSSNTAIATVDSDGTVHGVSPGQVDITATTADGTNISKTVTVTVLQQPTGVSVSGGSTVEQGSTLPLTATVTPSNASDKTVTWKTSNPAVATVDANGVVTGVGPGTADITATTANGIVSAAHPVTVTLASTSVAISPKPVSDINAGATTTLTATLTPGNSTDTVTWTSSAPGVATVDPSGKTVTVTGVSEGDVTITATTSSGKTDSVTIHINPGTGPKIPTNGDGPFVTETGDGGLNQTNHSMIFTAHRHFTANNTDILVIDGGMDQAGYVVLSGVVNGFNVSQLSQLTVTAVDPSLNSYFSVDYVNGVPCIVYTYPGTKQDWNSVAGSGGTPQLTVPVILHMPGYSDTPVNLGLRYAGSIVGA